MRFVVAGVVGILLAWGAYIASPYYALYRLSRAVQAGDVASVAARVNARALRVSLAKQFSAEIAAVAPAGSGISTADAQAAARMAFAFADPLLETLTDAPGVIDLLRRDVPGSPGGPPVGTRLIELADATKFLQASNWRGFRNVYVSLPPDAPAASRYRLQLRLGRLTWRLVSIELPPDVRRRLSADLVRRFSP